MVPIVFKEDQKFGVEEFNEYLLSLCEEHKQTSRALAFAFLVYDFKDNTIPQILKNESYWNALDVISGKFLSVFYIDSEDQYYKRRQKEIYDQRVKEQERNSREGRVSFFVQISPQLTPLENTGKFLRENFQIDEQIKTPFIFFFQVHDNQLTDYFIAQLKADRLEDAFLELKSLVKDAVAAMADIKEENFGNHQEIFNQLKERVESNMFFRTFNKKKDAALKFGSIIGFLKLISGIIAAL